MSEPMVFKDCTFTPSVEAIRQSMDKSSIFEPTGVSILPGDHFTMEVTPRLGWWGRLMVRLGMRVRPEPEIRLFTVTAQHVAGWREPKTHTYAPYSGVVADPYAGPPTPG